MVCAPVRRDNPQALARGLSTIQAHKPCSISLVRRYGVFRAEDWVSEDCGTICSCICISSI